MGLVPLAKRGEPQGGGNYELWLHSWYHKKSGSPQNSGRSLMMPSGLTLRLTLDADMHLVRCAVVQVCANDVG
jgi:hypothetical protein